MKTALERINKIVSKDVSPWKEETIERRKNRDWTDRSNKIAIMILREIRKQKPINGMTQKKLADEMDVTPQYINKVVKGKENLTLETVSKFEEILGIRLLEVPSSKASPLKQEEVIAVSKSGAIPIVKYELEYTNEFLSDSTGKYG
ncbi:MAG: helix-turn-helix transcriptional regulator [Dysgonamonadaceae bacterium]|nr:helix-turn-helix transcriptional regulator [Dysgonamonadaceae bacterium]